MDLKNVIIAEFEKVVAKAQDRFAKHLQTTPDKIQVVLGLNADESPRYILYNEYKPVRILSINEVLGVKIDLLGKAGMVEMFLGKVLPKVAVENEIPKEQLRVLCIQKDEKQFLFVANGSQTVKEIQLADLITDQELMPG